MTNGTRRGWGVSVTPRPLFTPRKHPVPSVQEAGWPSGRVWTGAENLAPTGTQSPDRPARSQSLYRLRYPAHVLVETQCEEVSSDTWRRLFSQAGSSAPAKFAASVVMLEKAGNLLYFKVGSGRKIPMTVLRIWQQKVKELDMHLTWNSLLARIM